MSKKRKSLESWGGNLKKPRKFIDREIEMKITQDYEAGEKLKK